MKINYPPISWDELGKKFLTKYIHKSSKALTSDINRIIEFLNEDWGDKQVEEINKNDIISNVQYHSTKTNDPLKSQNSVFKYIGRWKSFLEFLRIDEKLISSHLFINEINNVKEFKEQIVQLLNLNDEEVIQPYDAEAVLQVIRQIEKKIKDNPTIDQEYRLLQQSLFIQLTLLTGAPRRTLVNLTINELSQNTITINECKLILPKYTYQCLNRYLKKRDSRSKPDFEYLFTTVAGTWSNKKDDNARSLFSTNNILVNIFKECPDLLDEDITCISNNALRNTAIVEMIKAQEDLYTLLKLTGLAKNSIKELESYYVQKYDSDNQKMIRQLSKNANILIMKLPYYDFLNEGL